MNKLSDYKFIDIHYHASPDLYERRWHAIKAGQIYQSLHGAVFLTSHLGATSIQATLAQQLGLPVFSSLVLNHIAGGINYRVILQALNEYQPVIAAKMLVHFPTITGRPFQSKLSRKLSYNKLSKYCLKRETLFNSQQKIRQKAIDILKMANDYPIVLTTGHASKEEIYCLVDACITYNVPALLLNQPAHPLVNLKALNLEELTQNEFVWIEQTILTYLLGHQDKDDFAAVLKSTPRVIYSSDLGQINQMDVESWQVYSNSIFNELQLSPQRRDDLIRGNATQLLALS
ncbi:DUF6282 family protein [Legionella sp.]|uniref:DUF6282 family protein n=1 Tax=Legionella sp. TaxID=459 RepID=UPI003CA62DE6